MLSQDRALALQALMKPGGALDEVFKEIEGEAADLAVRISNMDFDSDEAGPKARALQGERRGMVRTVDRIKELIDEAAEPPKHTDDA